MDKAAIQKLSYGVYVITAVQDEKKFGCIANSVMQITSAPMSLAVNMNHDNATHDAILQSGEFAVGILATDTNPALIGGFGYRSSHDTDKFANASVITQGGIPIPKDVMAWVTCKVTQRMDAGSHTIFLGEVQDGALLRQDAIPMTYAYYRTVIKGKSPKNAPTYVESE